MNRFQYSQEIKERILADKNIYNTLRNHFLGIERLTDNLGSGTAHEHFRVGKLKNGLWITTREIHHCYTDHITGLESYCQHAEEINEDVKGKNIQEIIEELKDNEIAMAATSFTIGVRYRGSISDNFNYALLVEDLTAGGAIEYEDHNSLVKKVKGRDISICFDLEECFVPRPIKYMLDENMLIIEPTVINE